MSTAFGKFWLECCCLQQALAILWNSEGLALYAFKRLLSGSSKVQKALFAIDLERLCPCRCSTRAVCLSPTCRCMNHTAIGMVIPYEPVPVSPATISDTLDDRQKGVQAVRAETQQRSHVRCRNYRKMRIRVDHFSSASYNIVARYE